MVALSFSVAFLLFLLFRSTGQLQEFDNWPRYFRFCVKGFFIYPISLIGQALTWKMIMARLGQTSDGWGDIEIYSYSHLMRRLPGTVWYLAGRTTKYHVRGVRTSTTLIASGLEWLLLLIAAVLVYSTLSMTASNVSTFRLILLSTLLVGTAIGLRQMFLIGSRVSSVPMFFRNISLDSLSVASVPHTVDFTMWLVMYVFAYFIGGWILLVLVHGVAPGTTLSLMTAIKAWAATGGISFLLSAFIPAGLGIRELTLAMFLSLDMSMTGAILVAVLLRIVFSAGDLVWGGGLWGVAKVLGKR